MTFGGHIVNFGPSIRGTQIDYMSSKSHVIVIIINTQGQIIQIYLVRKDCLTWNHVAGCKFHLQPINFFCQLAACNGNNSMQDEFWHAACYHSWWFRHQSSAGCAFTLVKRGGNHKPLACKYKNKKVQYFTVQLWKSGESIHKNPSICWSVHIFF